MYRHGDKQCRKIPTAMIRNRKIFEGGNYVLEVIRERFLQVISNSLVTGIFSEEWEDI